MNVSEIIPELLKENNVPGLAITVVKNYETLISKGFGYRDIANNKKVDRDTIFPICSLTKAFTALSLGVLVDKKKLDWEDHIKDFLPEVKLYDEFASKQLNVVDILSHRSGLPRHDFSWYGSKLTTEEMIKRLPYLRPNREFRVVAQYQNLMFMIAGLLIERLSNQSLDEFMKENIFEPLEMKSVNTSIEVNQRQTNIALPYEVNKNNKCEQVPFRSAHAVKGAGFINASINDMSKWIILNLNKGKYKKRRVISEQSLNIIHQTVIPISSVDELFFINMLEFSLHSFALGWHVCSYRGYKLFQHSGSIDGFQTYISLVPSKNLGIVVLSNRGVNPLPFAITYSLIDDYLGLKPINWPNKFQIALDNYKSRQNSDIKSEKFKNIISRHGHGYKGNETLVNNLASFTGRYNNLGYGQIYIEKKDDKLMFKFNTFEGELNYIDSDNFFIDHPFLGKKTFCFFRDKDGIVNKLAVNLETRVDDICFEQQ